VIAWPAVRRPLRGFADAAIAVLIAPVCAACGSLLEHPTAGVVCPACWSAVRPMPQPTCRTCGDTLASWRTVSIEHAQCPRCRRREPLISRSAAIGPYEGALRTILRALKYNARTSIAWRVSELMRVSGTDVLLGADAVVPVPLHAARRRARGFNQADALARHLGPPVLAALRRTRRTAVQADLPAARRHANVRGAFAIAPRARINGLTLVLVDDVCTTGATLEACASALLGAGAADVRALTAARAVSRPR
jgi:ComF family protein